MQLDTPMPQMMPMDIAPPGDGWVVALAPQRIGGRHPWVVATRCDAGWSDEDGYILDPIGWFPLPDPQPKATGWRKAEGTIRIAPIIRSDIDWAKWMVFVVRPDGTDDPTREPDVAKTFADAEAIAAELAKRLGLPVEAPPSADVLAIGGGSYADR